jgi:cell wall-associated NlpC family hydrolase
MRKILAALALLGMLVAAAGLGAGILGVLLSGPAGAASPRSTPGAHTVVEPSPATAETLQSQIQARVTGAGGVGGMLAFALSKIGTPYQWGGDGRDGFYDCSGFTMRAFEQVGVHLPRTARAQYQATQPIDPASLQIGDLLFWAYDTANPATIHHVAIYLGTDPQGRDRMIDAPHTGATIQPRDVYWSGFLGATRPLATP